MSETSYVAGVHYLVKALDGVTFPVDKEAVLEKCGDSVVRIGRDEYRTVAELIAPIDAERFENAAALHNAIIAHLPSLASGC